MSVTLTITNKIKDLSNTLLYVHHLPHTGEESVVVGEYVSHKATGGGNYSLEVVTQHGHAVGNVLKKGMQEYVEVSGFYKRPGYDYGVLKVSHHIPLRHLTTAGHCIKTRYG